MPEGDYSSEELFTAMNDVHLLPGDTVYCHSNIGLFGRVSDNSFNRDFTCRLFLEAIQSAIGPQGTLIVPTYTYSYSNNLPFDPENSPSRMGVYSEWIRQHPESRRSYDPFFSVAALGPKADYYCDNLPPNSFAPNSTFDRLLESNGVILCLNHPGCTLLHFVERQLGVPYRFDKRFSGEFILHDVRHEQEWDIWVRYLSDDLLKHSPKAFVKKIKEYHLARWCNVGRGEVLAVSAQNVLKIVEETLAVDPWFLTAAAGLGIEPLIDANSR